jgi:hypothetical protein
MRAKESLMNRKLLSIAAMAGLLIGSTALVQAQSRGGGMGGGAAGASPGHQMQSPGGSEERSEGPGASGFSPGHEMKEGEGKGGPGASGLAPGHNKGTTGAGDRDDRLSGDRDDRLRGDRDDRLRGDRDDRMMDEDRRGIDKE